MDKTQLLIIGMAALGFLLIMQATRRNWRKSHSRVERPARERYQELQRSASASRDLEQVMLELDQLARQIHGKLDTRFAKLEAVIRDADERIDRLARLAREARGQQSLDVTIDDGMLAEAASTVAQTRTTPSAQETLTPRGQQQREAIYKLSDDGVDAIAIAQQMGRTTGEVELILSLRKASNAALVTSSAD
jgi:hypothetical protein